MLIQLGGGLAKDAYSGGGGSRGLFNRRNLLLEWKAVGIRNTTQDKQHTLISFSSIFPFPWLISFFTPLQMPFSVLLSKPFSSLTRPLLI